jgi:hypothetical protein
MKRPGSPPRDALAAELAAQRELLESLLGQVTLLAQTVTIIRADQLRLLAARGEAPPDVPDLHRCNDPEHHHLPQRTTTPPAPVAAATPARRGKTPGTRSRNRSTGGRHGR